MGQKNLVARSFVEFQEGGTTSLRYFLTAVPGADGGGESFEIEIEQSGGLLGDDYASCRIHCGEKQAKSLLELFAEGCVFPISLEELVEDWKVG